MRAAIALALASFVPACFPGRLSAVSAGAPAQQREAAYQALRPVREGEVVEVTSDRHGVYVREDDELVLGNGTIVRHADDLLPVVPPGSAAAGAATRSAEARSHKWKAGLLGMAAMLAGGGMMVYGLSNDPDAPIGMYQARSPGFITAGVVVVLAGAVGGGIAGLHYGAVERRERLAAFASYDDALRQELALCAHGLQLVPCEQVAPPSDRAPSAAASSP